MPRSTSITVVEASPVRWPLRQLQLELVNVCNYRCPLCRTLEKDHVPRGRLAVEDAIRLLEPVATGLTTVTLYGTRGEPFLHPGLERVVAWLQEHSGARTEVSTNGSLVGPERAEAILAAGLDRLIFAVDGLSEESYQRYRVGGTLAPVLENIRRTCELKARGGYSTRVVFQLIPMSSNEAELAELPQLAYGLGVDEVRLKVSGSVDRNEGLRPSDPSYRTSPRASDWRTFDCPFGLDKLYVDPNGDCYTCCYGEGHPQMLVGNALRDGLPRVWRSPLLERIREAFDRGTGHHPFCVKRCARRGVKRKLKLARPTGVL